MGTSTSLGLMLIPTELSKPSVPRLGPNPFVLNGGDLWGMGAKGPAAAGTGVAGSPLTLSLFCDNFSGQIVDVLTTRSKNVNPMVAVQHGSVGPRLETVRFSESETLLQLVARDLTERIELTLN
jgi:hypothetical protein